MIHTNVIFTESTVFRNWDSNNKERIRLSFLFKGGWEGNTKKVNSRFSFISFDRFCCDPSETQYEIIIHSYLYIYTSCPLSITLYAIFLFASNIEFNQIYYPWMCNRIYKYVYDIKGFIWFSLSRRFYSYLNISIRLY